MPSPCDAQRTVANVQIVGRQVLRVREFRYGPTDRARYMVRERDPVTLEPLETTWHEYLGDQIYQDLLIDDSDPNHPVVTPTARYDFAYGLIGLDDAAGRRFVHADMLGTTRLLTGDVGPPTPGDPTGTVRAALAFTAFGEPLGVWSGDGAALPRYGYAGAWGYQSDSLADPGVFYAPLLHVGARWYDPRLGRFLQRDPIGIAGGLNVYAYVAASPLVFLDPSGQFGLLQIGVRVVNRTIEFAFRLRGGVWLVGVPGRIIVPVLNYQAQLSIYIPVLFDGRIPGPGDPTKVNCLITALHAVGRGWGLP